MTSLQEVLLRLIRPVGLKLIKPNLWLTIEIKIHCQTDNGAGMNGNEEKLVIGWFNSLADSL